MRCYACQQINTETARFCVECGASLAAGAWGQPAVIETQYAPAPYAPPAPQLPSRMTAVAATALGAAPMAHPANPVMVGQGPAYAPYGYVPAQASNPNAYVPAQAPAPMAGPSLINNVTVTQSAPAPSPQPQPAPSVQMPLVVMTRRVGILGILLRAAYFLGSGLIAGILWVAVVQTPNYSGNQGYIAALALLVTIVVLMLDIVVLDRFARH